jgi:hypothetical protein
MASRFTKSCLTAWFVGFRLFWLSLDQGVVSRLRTLHSRRGLSVSRLEVGVANDYFLMHSSRPPTEASIEMAEQLAPSCGPCRGVIEAA